MKKNVLAVTCPGGKRTPLDLPAFFSMTGNAQTISGTVTYKVSSASSGTSVLDTKPVYAMLAPATKRFVFHASARIFMGSWPETVSTIEWKTIVTHSSGFPQIDLYNRL